MSRKLAQSNDKRILTFVLTAIKSATRSIYALNKIRQA